jgi:hypothetical protein
LHSIETMMGVHAAKMGQNKTLHGRNWMKIIILTHNRCRGANYLAIKMSFCVGLSFISKLFWRLAVAQASPQPACR